MWSSCEGETWKPSSLMTSCQPPSVLIRPIEERLRHGAGHKNGSDAIGGLPACTRSIRYRRPFRNKYLPETITRAHAREPVEGTSNASDGGLGSSRVVNGS